MRLKAAITIAATLAAATAHASSGDAWEEFASDVETSCLKAVEGQAKGLRAVVDPYGTERFGVAILAGSSAYDGQKVSFVCVYDKQSQAAEINQGFGADQVTVTIP